MRRALVVNPLPRDASDRPHDDVVIERIELSE